MDSPPPRDSTARDYLASERTFLAWIRTSIGVISLGFVVAKFSLWLRQMLAIPLGGQPGAVQPGLSFPVGLALIAWGAVLAPAAWLRYRAVNEAIRSGTVLPARSLAVLVVLSVVIPAAALFIYLLVTTPA